MMPGLDDDRGLAVRLPSWFATADQTLVRPVVRPRSAWSGPSDVLRTCTRLYENSDDDIPQEYVVEIGYIWRRAA